MKQVNYTDCEVCGSNNLEQITKKEIVSSPYSDDIEIEVVEFVCNECETKIDYTKIYEAENYKNAVDLSVKSSVANMLDHLSKEGYTWAGIERALDLPQRTISRWRKDCDVSSTGVTLLRLISTFPWLLEIADSKYEKMMSKEILVREAFKEMLKASNIFEASCKGVGVLKNEYSAIAYAAYSCNCEDGNIVNTSKVQSESAFEEVYYCETT